MFKLSGKNDLSQISLTGARGLMLIDLLAKAPRSLNEIREEFIKMGIMDNSHSNDILRIDINTLKAVGCEISRSSKSTNYKHVLLKHPFGLTVTDEEIDVIKKSYRKIKVKADINELIKYDALFLKIGRYINDKQMQEKFYGISALKSYDSFMIKSLQDDCKNKRTLRLIYKRPVTKQEVEKVIVAQRILFNNDKFYLCGIDANTKESLMFHLKRIKKVIGRITNQDSNFEIKTINVKFILKSFGVAGLDDNETIISKTEDGYIVQGEYYNEFVALQRILSFGSECIVIEPLDFRQKLISTLKRMREIYNG